MKRLQPEKEILKSWRWCVEKGVSIKALAPVLTVKDELLESKKRENSLLISVFENCSSKINVLITSRSPILLVNTDGIIIKICSGNNLKKKRQNSRRFGIY